jgi:hypothetical protein
MSEPVVAFPGMNRADTFLVYDIKAADEDPDTLGTIKPHLKIGILTHYGNAVTMALNIEETRALAEHLQKCIATLDTMAR